MKVKKPHPKRLVPPVRHVLLSILTSLTREPQPLLVKALIENLTTCTESEIPEIVDGCHEWPYPKSDMYNWIPVLNRFDGILETVVESCGLKGIQKRPFTSDEKPTVLAILKISRLLWENCNNRNLYNSFEHLTDLLQTTDLDVLDATLKLLLKPAQRVGNQRSLRATFLTAQDRLLTLAQHWAMTEHISLADLASTSFEISEDSGPLHYQFYRISITPQTAEVSSSVAGDASAANAAKDANGSEGLISISVPHLVSAGKSETDLYDELKDTYDVPQEHQFRFFHKIRVAISLSNPALRHKLLILRILAVAVVVNLIAEDVAQTKLFLYEPELIQKLADLLHSDSGRTQPNRSSFVPALYALDNISRYRGKLGEVLTTVNASATHGILMFIVRRVITNLDSESNMFPVVMEFPQEYLDSLFNYIAYVITTQSGGNMVITAGIIPALTSALEKPPSHHIKNVTRIVGLLDSITYGFSNSFNFFANANGLDTLISRIRDEVALCLEMSGVGKDAMVIDGQHLTGRSDLPHEHTAYLRAMLKFVLHLMQTSGRADRMRNLIDSSIPSSVLDIFKHAQLFGANVFGLAVNIMSTFIHNEPTCLNILQEAKLPQAFLEAVTSNIPVSTEVISSLPNAFGAICLNQQGLAAFNEAKPMGKFFEIFISDEHLRTMQDNDFPHLIGTSIDELIRHHPTLKDDILTAILAMLNRIVENGLVLSAEDSEICSLQVGKPEEVKTEEEKEKEKSDTARRETKVGGSVDVAARFLEGLFQNVAHCKDFVKMDGTQILIKMVSLPALPFDFVSSDSAYALTYLFRMMIELSTSQVVSVVTKELHQVFKSSMDLLSTNEKSSSFAQYIDLLEGDSDSIQKGNHTLQTMRTLHIFVRLLTDVYCSHMTPHRIAPAIGQAFTGSLGEELLPMFGQLHRYGTAEQSSILTKNTATFSGVANGTSGEASTPAGDAVSVTATSVATPQVDEQSTGEDDQLDSDDRRVKNTRMYKGLLTDIPSALVTLFEGIIRLLTARRLTDPALKKQTPKIFENIGVVLLDHITWNVAKNLVQSQYYAALLGHLSFMLMDDRNQLTLQTFTVVAFHKCGGFTVLMKLAKETWEIAAQMDLKSEEGDQAEKDYRSQISTIIEACVGIFSAVTNDRYLHDAPSTVLINRMERDTDEAPFDPHEFLVEMRSRILPFTFELLSSPQLSTKTVNIVRTLLTTFGHILKGQGEVSTNRSDALGGSSSATSAVSSALAAAAAADNERVQMLVDMGFPRGAAEMALIRTGNVNRAADYLLAHAHEVSMFANTEATVPVPAPPVPPTATMSTAGEPTSASDNTNEATVTEPAQAEFENPAAGTSGTDTPATSTTGLGIELNESNSEKGKGKVNDGRKHLDELRAQIKEKFVEIGLKVAYMFEDVGLDVKHMVMMVDKDRLMELVDLVLRDIHDAETKGPTSMDTDGENRGLPESTSVQYRLLALTCHDAALQEKVLSRMKSLLQPMLNAVDKEAKASSPAVWLASMLLVIESFISSVDEPKQGLKSTEEAPVSMELDDLPSGISMEQRTKLLRDVVLLLEKENLEIALVHSLLSVAIRLTRTHTLAVEFAHAGGIATLFYSSRIGSFPAQTQFTLILLRHIIEDSVILQRAMEHEIQSWFNSPRTRSLDMTSFLRSHAHVVCRSESSFVKACENTVVLTKPDASPQKQTLAPKSTDTKEKSGSTKDHSSGLPAGAEGAEVSKVAEPSISPVELLRPGYVTDVSESVVSFIVGEILGMRSRDSIVAEKVPSQSKDDLTRSTETHIRRAFLLQCLSELLSSYPTCRIDVINSTGRRGGKTPLTPNKTKNNFVSQLQIQGPVSTAAIPANVELDIRKRTLEYMWGASVLAGLCIGVGLDHGEEKRLYPELSTVRKVVLESIHRSLRDATHTSMETMTSSNAAIVEAKYIRYLALADVTNRIVTTRSASQIPRGSGVRSQAGNEDVSLHIGKVMLEKNFVGLLTTVLGDIEQQHPAAPILIHAILKPLEWLSKIAIKMGRGVPAPEKGKSHEDKESGQPLSTPVDAGVDDAVESNIEISEMLRNSALGIFNAHDTDEDEEEEDESGTEDQEEDGYEEFDDEMSEGDEEEEDDEVAAGMATDDDVDDEDDEDDEEDDDEDDDGEDVEMEWGNEGAGQDVDGEEIEGAGNGETPGHDDDEYETEEDADGQSNDEDDDIGDPNDDEDDDGEDLDNDQPMPLIYEGEIADGEEEDGGFGDRFIPPRFGGGLSLFGVEPLRASPRALPNQDLFVHPFLSDGTQAGSAPSGRSERSDLAGRLGNSRRPRVEPPEWPMGDDALGGSAMLLLDQMIGRRGLSTIHPELGLPGGPGPLDQGVSIFDRTGHVIGSTNGILPTGLPNRSNTAAMASLAFLSIGSVDRWYQEALLLYGNTVLEKATRSTNAILNALIPIALEVKRKQAAQRKAEEQERKAKEEEKRKADEASQGKESAEAEVDQVGLIEGSTSGVQQNEVSEATESVDVHMEDAAPLVTVEPVPMQSAEETGVGETPVLAPEGTSTDATIAVGSDATTTEEPTTPAQEASLSTAQREERVVVMVNGREVDITGSGIDPTFLEALPDDLRQEVISQHAREQQRVLNQNPAQAPISTEFLDALPPEIREEVLAQERISQRAAPVSSSGPVELDPATFIATLDEQLRQTVLLEQDDLMLSSLPPEILAEANVLRDRVVRTANRYHQRLQHHQHHLSLNGLSAPRPANIAAKKVHRDGIQLVDKTALMTILKLLFVPEPVSKSSVHRLLLNLCENAKTRMELISLLLSSLSDGSAELGQVDKSFSQMTLKGKGKAGPATPKKQLIPNVAQISGGEMIPNLITSRSLEALIHLVQYNEPVAHFFLTESDTFAKAQFANASAPTTPSAKRLSKGKDKMPSAGLSGIGQSKFPVVILMGLLDRPGFLNNTAIMDLLMALLANIFKHLPVLARKNPATAATEATNTVSQTTTASGLTAPASDSSQPPSSGSIQSAVQEGASSLALPDASVRSVVNVLTGGECTSKTFQSNLSVLQNLTAVSAHNRELIMNELIDSAQKLGDSMTPSLEELREVLGKATSALDVQSVTLAMFAPPSSHQAKLLRVMKAVDFAFSKPTHPVANNNSKPDSKLDEDPQSALRAAFEKLTFNKLWYQLGECLRAVDATPDLINIATVLLPVIESFMVVSKPFVGSAQSAASTRQVVSQKSIKSFNEMSHEDMFVGFTEEHRKILNTMVRNNPSLMSGSFSLLVRNPKVLEFDNKRTYFTQQLTKRSVREHYGTLQINVRRQYVFEDSFHQLQSRSGNEIKYSKLSVRFYEEEGVDAGGVTREWFTVLARQMFNPDYALFKPSAADRVTYQPNRFSGINPDHLLYFKFVGRIIGKAIYDGRLLDAYFTRSFYKCMLGIAVDWKDMEAIDPEFHKSLEWILNNDITDVLDLTFIAEVDEFGKKRDIDLKPDGQNIAVTEQNKHEYVKLITEYKLTTAIREQIDAFLSGFHEIIPKDLVSIFNEQELELLISGLPDIDIDDWKNNCEYSNYSQSSPQVQWFWRAVRSFTQEERAKLIQFATGTSKVPLEGFSHLQGSNGVQKFQIHKDFSSASRLPSAHTCFNQIDLPQYESYEQLRQNLLTAISECGTGEFTGCVLCSFAERFCDFRVWVCIDHHRYAKGMNSFHAKVTCLRFINTTK
ncbi:hypothetical protein BJ742DRAFT_675473 [Cladochytrium replicatum]|nr:hypothetical protein BJ742DRAFT_675473 [Cladochytrium replicatum]